MNFLKMKYKAHRLINFVFYGFVFFAGFILGRSSQNLNFNQIISKYFYIQNVEAMTIDPSLDTFTRPTSSTWYTESLIYDIFSESSTFMYNYFNESYSFNDYSHVYVYCNNSGGWNCSNNYTFTFATNEFYSSGGSIYVPANTSVIAVSLNYYTNSASINTNTYSSAISIINHGMNYQSAATNSSLLPNYLLDFQYYFDLIFNPNYLDNNSNFTKYCFDSQDSTFSIYPLNVPNSSNTLTGFFLNTGRLNHYVLTSITFPDSSGDLTNTNNLDYLRQTYFLNSADAFNEFSNDSSIELFNSRYPGMYNNLYGWSIEPFNYKYEYTQGSNLFNGTIVTGSWTANGIDTQTKRLSINSMIPVQPGIYHLNFDTTNGIDNWAFFCSESTSDLSNITTTGWISDSNYVVDSSCPYLAVSFRKSNNAVLSTSNISNVSITKLSGNLTIPVYKFKDTYQINVGCISSSIGGVSQCVAPDIVTDWTDSSISNTSELCIFVPNNFGVKTWTTDAFGDIKEDTLTFDGITYNVDTNTFEEHTLRDINSNNYSGFLGYFSVLVGRLATPLKFITDNITYLFNGLPQPIQYFIISFFVIGLVVGLIKMLTGGK